MGDQESGAVLVRSDEHVDRRSDDPEEALLRAIQHRVA